MTISSSIWTNSKPDKRLQVPLSLKRNQHATATFGGLLVKKLLICIVVSILIMSTALAIGNLDSAYQRASEEAGETTTTIIECINLTEFEEHFGLSLSEDEKKLVRIALMAYSNGDVLVHPAGINNNERATIINDPYVGNKNSHKFHYPWCSSVADISEKNKVTFSSREEAVSEDYVPCKRCNP